MSPPAAATSTGAAEEKTQFRAPKPSAPAAPAAGPGDDVEKTQFRPPRAASPSPGTSPPPQTGPTPTDTGTRTDGRTPTGSRPTNSSWTDVGRAVADAPTLGPGSVVKDRVVLEEELGRGGMGVVYKARDLP